MHDVRIGVLGTPVASTATNKREPPPRRGGVGEFASGAYRDRTGDLLLAKQALSQLS
jgi:hypothetical protein